MSFAQKYIWEIVSLTLVAVAMLLIVLYTERAYIFKPIGWYQNGHVVIDASVLEQYYTDHGGSALVSYAKEKGASLSIANFHSTGHAVGDVLFNHEGLAAVALCGDSFEWGCLHQVMGRAYATMGPTALAQLQKQCDSYAASDPERGQCEHGLGHGLMYASNYDPTQIESVLDQCDGVTRVRPIPWNDSCHAGAMMEFNEHFMTMEYVGENGRPASTTAPFMACDPLTGDHKEVCIFWTVPWLHGKLFNFTYTDTSAFRQLGAYCEALPTTRLQTVCFESIGRSVGLNADLPPTQVLTLCTTASQKPALQRECLESAASVYLYDNDARDAVAICALVKNDPLRACRDGVVQ